MVFTDRLGMEIPISENNQKNTGTSAFFSLPLVQEAYELGRKRYNGLKSISGKTAFDHNLEAAKIVAEMTQDPTTIAATLLHDATERGIESSELKNLLGDEVTDLILTREKFKLGIVQSFASKRKDNMGKLVLALTKDLRLVLIEFACRLHNLRRIEELPKDIKQALLEESKEVYSLLAHKLGMYQIKAEMEDLWFQQTMPDVCQELIYVKHDFLRY